MTIVFPSLTTIVKKNGENSLKALIFNFDYRFGY